VDASTQARPMTDDEKRLAELGYKQELNRRMTGFQNFALSFTIISILSGALTLYGTGINYGGPIQEAWGWPIVSIFVIIVALSMAELASAYPTAGGLYWWASKLGSPAWGWFTGWFNLIGQVAITAGIDYGAAIFTTTLLNLVFSYGNDTHHIMYAYVAILILHATLNIFNVRLVGILTHISAYWHVAGVAIIALLPAKG
jgi:amino acid transporter